ncbi:hypothetical protein EYW49_09250 [Siculibacillus lacustris]|uniref:Uncharacterized protein n=1 Tax=Siculibacillus lacustris TaxID=1549641 RepID=A0A4Q9VTX5_9HYPH|nr:hypothetical protein [Siculibacillus lacustris]TBW38445.1 hypothetical protein EYW49_09250 [Siculibacillus lacustris]
MAEASDGSKKQKSIGEVLMSSGGKIGTEAVKNLLKESDKYEFFHSIVKKGGAEALKIGVISAGQISPQSEHLADGLSDHFTVVYEIGRSGLKLNPLKIAQLSGQFGVGIGKIMDKDSKHSCAISVGVVGIGVLKASGALLAAEPTLGASLVEVGSLGYDVYKMDEQCGISKEVNKKIEEKAMPMYMWFNDGIEKWIRSGGN